MKNWMFAAAILAAAAATAGCSCARGFEQWKCDSLGWCPRGTQPTLQQVAYPPPVVPVAPGVAVAPAPAVPVTPAPAVVSPPFGPACPPPAMRAPALSPALPPLSTPPVAAPATYGTP